MKNFEASNENKVMLGQIITKNSELENLSCIGFLSNLMQFLSTNPDIHMDSQKQTLFFKASQIMSKLTSSLVNDSDMLYWIKKHDLAPMFAQTIVQLIETKLSLVESGHKLDNSNPGEAINNCLVIVCNMFLLCSFEFICANFLDPNIFIKLGQYINSQEELQMRSLEELSFILFAITDHIKTNPSHQKTREIIDNGLLNGFLRSLEGYICLDLKNYDEEDIKPIYMQLHMDQDKIFPQSEKSRGVIKNFLTSLCNLACIEGGDKLLVECLTLDRL